MSREGQGSWCPACPTTPGPACSPCRPFALNDLDDYEKHFTVMNYDPEVVLKQVGAWRGLGSGFTQTPTPSCQSVRWAGSVGRSCVLAPV